MPGGKRIVIPIPPPTSTWVWRAAGSRGASELIAFYPDLDDEQKIYILRHLGRLQNAVVSVFLQRLLYLEEMPVLWSVCLAIGQQNRPRPGDLIGLLLHTDDLVRLAAVLALGRLADQSSLPSLLALSSDRNPIVRAMAVWAVGCCRSKCPSQATRIGLYPAAAIPIPGYAWSASVPCCSLAPSGQPMTCCPCCKIPVRPCKFVPSAPSRNNRRRISFQPCWRSAVEKWVAPPGIPDSASGPTFTAGSSDRKTKTVTNCKEFLTKYPADKHSADIEYLNQLGDVLN